MSIFMVFVPTSMLPVIPSSHNLRAAHAKQAALSTCICLCWKLLEEEEDQRSIEMKQIDRDEAAVCT